MEDKFPNENNKEEEDTMELININEEMKKKINENNNNNIKEDKKEKLEQLEEIEKKEKSFSLKNLEKKERSPFNLEGAKLPLSKYTRRSFNISLLKNYLKENSSSGICGSVNLGNTCYMNSSIACLSNCIELTYYFISGQYKDDINYENKYGLNGKLAESWYDLLHEYWVENNNKGNPKDLKYIIGEKDIRFRGYGQQDSNEFINIFLDILNEDLNYSNEKKYIELEEKQENEKDEECSKRFWDANLIRNDSVITDLFCGLFKSTIICPKCNKVSITFEPFYSINLPLKENKKKKISEINKKNIDEYKIIYVPKYGIRTTFYINFQDIPNLTQIKDCIDIIKDDENFDYKDLLKNVNYFKMDSQINYGETDEDSFIDENFNILLYEVNNITQNNELKIPIYFIFSKPEGTLELSEYPRLIFCEKNTTLSEFRKQIYFLSRKYILSPFINLAKEKIDFLSKEITKYRKDKSIEDDYIFNLIEEEYERIFNENISEEDIKYLKEYIKNMPYKLTLRELMGNNIIQVFEYDNMNELTKKFKKLTMVDDIYACINEIMDKIGDFLVTIEFNYDSKYINKQNYTFNSHNSINIKYPNNSEEEKEEEKGEKEDNKKQNLIECLNYFCKEEQLKIGNEWYCNKCKEHLLAKKKIDLYYLPKILIISFKRFIKESQQWEKNDENIDFPINNFNMKDLIIGPDKDHSIYDLFAVSQHYGSTGFGHYTAVCKNGDKWYNYDDSSVTQTSPKSCLSSSAYVLFYRRQTD